MNPPHAANGSSYDRTGELLRAKHRLVHHDSGRRFEAWALGLVPVAAARQLLDAGCGWGRFTWTLVDAFGVPPAWITGADLSHGMLLTAREEAEARESTVRLCQGSIEALPFRAQCFDLAVAGHVLYHVPDMVQGAYELARVLRPEGVLLATTNADAARVLVLEVHAQALQTLGLDPGRDGASRFPMETGGTRLQPAFAQVEAVEFRDTTTFADVAAFMASYRTLGRYQAIMADEAIPAPTRARLDGVVESLARAALARVGALRSETRMGAFVCRGPRQPAASARAGTRAAPAAVSGRRVPQHRAR